MDSLKRKQIYEQVMRDMASDGQLTDKTIVNEMKEPPLYIDTDMVSFSQFSQQIIDLGCEICNDNNEDGEKLIRELKHVLMNPRLQKEFFNNLIIRLEQSMVINNVEDQKFDFSSNS
jgi:hypothetical protein